MAYYGSYRLLLTITTRLQYDCPTNTAQWLTIVLGLLYDLRLSNDYSRIAHDCLATTVRLRYNSFITTE